MRRFPGSAAALGPCPGCGVILPEGGAEPHRYVSASSACWAAYGEVLAAEYSDPVIFGACHELSVDAYIAQHPGGAHPTRSIVVHLAGLHLALDRGLPPAMIPAERARLAQRAWPGPDPTVPERWGPLSVRDLVAVAGTTEHADVVRRFAAEVWQAWSAEHEHVRAFIGP